MKSLLKVTKSLADRNRVRIVLALLEHDELCACQLIELLGISGATASRHLGQLVQADLIESRKDGRWVYYMLAAGVRQLDIIKWLSAEATISDEWRADSWKLREILSTDPLDLCKKQRS
ncbi:ArsR/SmtB family transcription factor [Persicirhabdus sediminis]|uniref:Winged helix-turn-helix transcriptional regulator n=1 Tax=Persicirhabdus sediminis TaxID=454144 RepID=A0A8J7MFS3_9BACT|nr:metalloregulator ArsR/SmtB family transcription factor [Persicirhabdus sediminis]MBK1792362.1 winged helix-turn-helix transcriptional regulator [Persicirhabdus sediminis]